MKLAVISFTAAGKALSLRLAKELSGDTCTLFTTNKLADTAVPSYGSDLQQWTGSAFVCYDGLIFIGACGIAVRAVAPHVKSKTTDPAVVVLDEQGQFAISLLSGHIGSANTLTLVAARAVQATPVITTATDINGLFSIDSWAARHNLFLSDMKIAKEISARLLRREPVGMTADWFILPQLPAGFTSGTAPVGAAISVYEDFTPYPQTLRLIPKLVSIGIGCKQGVCADAIEAFVLDCLRQENISPHSIKQVCSIDLKQNEPGLLEFCKRHGLPVRFYSARQLSRAKGVFSSSAFVQQTTGVDNVCERACVLGAQQGALIVPKLSKDGVTFAAALQDWRATFESENRVY